MKRVIYHLHFSHWINSDPITPESLHGRPVLLHFFQMLCPSCVVHSLPIIQALWLRRKQHRLQVIAVHSVFEHHAQMNPAALQAFLSEFNYQFPVAVDQSASGRLPQTMAELDIPGTPSSLLIDAEGREAWRHFGRLEPIDYGLLAGLQGRLTDIQKDRENDCDQQACEVARMED